MSDLKLVKGVFTKPEAQSIIGVTIGEKVIKNNGKQPAIRVPIISKLDPDGLCANTSFESGMRMLEINGIACRNRDDTFAMLRMGQGEMTILAGPVTMVAATVTKPDKETKVGLRLKKGTDSAKNIFISNIEPEGLFAKTDVKEGMRLHSINEFEVTGVELDEVLSVISGSTGNITILAEDLALKKRMEAAAAAAAKANSSKKLDESLRKRHQTNIETGSAGYFVAKANETILIGIKGTSSVVEMITDSLAVSMTHRCSPYSPFTKSSSSDKNIGGGGESMAAADANNNSVLKDNASVRSEQSDNTVEGDVAEIACHEGILATSIKLLEDIQPLLDPYVKKGYKVRLAGHSLGAGAASVLAVLLRSKYVELQKDSDRLHAYCFATPPVLDIQSAQRSKDFVTSIVNRDDCVTRMSIANVEILIRLLEKIDHKILKREGLNNYWKMAKEFSHDGYYAEKMTDDSFSELVNLLHEAQKAVEVAHTDHLYVPGKIIAFYATVDELPGKGQNAEVSIRKAYITPCHLFLRSFEISDRMFSDHLTSSYQESLHRCIGTMENVVVGNNSKCRFRLSD